MWVTSSDGKLDVDSHRYEYALDLSGLTFTSSDVERISNFYFEELDGYTWDEIVTLEGGGIFVNGAFFDLRGLFVQYEDVAGKNNPKYIGGEWLCMGGRWVATVVTWGALTKNLELTDYQHINGELAGLLRSIRQLASLTDDRWGLARAMSRTAIKRWKGMGSPMPRHGREIETIGLAAA